MMMIVIMCLIIVAMIGSTNINHRIVNGYYQLKSHCDDCDHLRTSTTTMMIGSTITISIMVNTAITITTACTITRIMTIVRMNAVNALRMCWW